MPPRPPPACLEPEIHAVSVAQRVAHERGTPGRHVHAYAGARPDAGSTTSHPDEPRRSPRRRTALAATATRTADQRHLDAIADADLFPYWYDDVDEPDSNPTLVRTESCDLCVVGGGYTGLWTAIIAKERDPSRDVVLIDAAEIGSAASGRNGGFMESSLTHGVANGQAALPRRDRAARAARPARTSTPSRTPSTATTSTATSSAPASSTSPRRRTRRATSTSCATTHDQLRRLGQDARWLDAEAMRAEVDSPTYTGGLWRIGPGRARRPGPPGLGPEVGRRAARRADLRGHQGDRRSSATASACS